jgi:hypothetical protein
VDEPNERQKAIKHMAEIGASQLSTNFLAAHGLEKSEGWQGLNPGKPFKIVKLKNIIETVALGSPK